MLSMTILKLADFIGVSIVLVFAFMILKNAFGIQEKIKGTNIWYFLYYLTIAQFSFAVARSVGHILKHLLITVNLKSIWIFLRPYSGGTNTITFIIVFSVALLMTRSLKSFAE